MPDAKPEPTGHANVGDRPKITDPVILDEVARIIRSSRRAKAASEPKPPRKPRRPKG